MGGGEAGEIYRIDSKGRVEEVARLSGFCGGLAVSPQDDLLVIMAREYGVLDKILFGSDYPFTTPEVTLDALGHFNQITEGTGLPRLSPEEIGKITSNPTLS